MNFKVCSEQELSVIIDPLINAFKDKKVILFYGEMGAGKTTLIKILCQYLGVEESTTSPTFSIVNEYLGAQNSTIYHFDFYRVEKEEEVMDLGYEDYFYSDNYCFVEWPEKISNLLPEDTVNITIAVDEENNRLISVAC